MKQLLSFTILLFISASFAFGGSLQGVVRDAQSLNPIEGVNVTVHVVRPDSIAFPAVTDQNGAYSITGIVANNEIYVVMTHKDGYVFSYTRIDNLGSLDLVYDISLTPDGTLPPAGDSSIVTGKVMAPSAQSGTLTLVQNGKLGFTSGQTHVDVVTDAAGTYSAKIPPGSYTVAISAAGYDSLTVKGVHVEQEGATLNAVLKSAVTGVDEDPVKSAPGKFALLDVYPNPFNPAATIQFSLPENGWATLKVYNMLGNEVTLLAAGEFAGGVEHRVTFNASKLAGGVYFSRLEFKNQKVVKKLTLVK